MEKCNGTNGDKNGTRKENRNNQYYIILAIKHAIFAHFSLKWAQNVCIFKGYCKLVATSSNQPGCMQLRAVFHF